MCELQITRATVSKASSKQARGNCLKLPLLMETEEQITATFKSDLSISSCPLRDSLGPWTTYRTWVYRARNPFAWHLILNPYRRLLNVLEIKKPIFCVMDLIAPGISPATLSSKSHAAECASPPRGMFSHALIKSCCGQIIQRA
jgi:hypothetical protein